MMKKTMISVDFNRKTKEKIKPLHGVNNSPITLNEPPPGFREAGIPYCRLHDAGGPYGGAHYVDIPNVFPNFDADPAKPESYDFAFTDAYLAQLNASGTKIFYRLGVSIENNYRIKGYHNHPPEDFKKWAEICAGVIRHYTRGWANGFQYDIQYWEIWNEPENTPMWDGTREEFFELYRVTSKYLKKEFPEIRIGGYGSCGFYTVNRTDCSDFYKSFVLWFEEFLKFVTNKKTRCPLDFFSWHLYTDDPDEIAIHADYVQTKLEEYGLPDVEKIFNEWNYISDDPKRRYLEMKDNEGASFVSAAFCRMQDSPINKSMYYDALPTRSYCGLYHFPGNRTTQTYSAFAMWNTLYVLQERCIAKTDNKRVYVCAAKNRKDKAVFITNFSPEGCLVELELHNAELKDFQAEIIDKRHDRETIKIERIFRMPPYSTVLLSTKKEKTLRIAESKVRQVHAGLDDSSVKKQK
ncbi:MAG: hypothetical protein J6W81_00070 [Lentisphaeria bacterium]|nr:hypothetical protein [Lentisphaeria bacterium]